MTAATKLDRWCRRAELAPLALLVGVAVATFRDYGITLDEEMYSEYGRAMLAYYASFFQDLGVLRLGNLYYYGGLFDALAEFVASFTPRTRYEARHLVNACVGLLAIVATARIGERLAGGLAGLLAAACLALTPMFYGHLFNNPKDSPFTACWALALWAMLAAWDELPRLGARRVLLLGLAIGAALGVRAGGLALFGHLVLLGALRIWGAPNRRAAFAALAGSLVKVWAVAWGVMLLCWPWAVAGPFTRPFEALRVLLRINSTAPTLFDGRVLQAADAPASYVPVWFAVSLPEHYLLAALAGVGAALAGERGRAGAPPDASRRLQLTWLGWTSVGTLLGAVATQPYLYDAVRHFLFVLPALSVLCGVAAAGFLRSRAARPARLLLGGTLAASAALTVVDMVRLHPYQSVYLNRLVAGGMARGAARFETDYWSSSMKEGTEWVIAHYGIGIARKVKLASTGMPVQCRYYLEASSEGMRRFLYVPLDSEPHVVLATTRAEQHGAYRGRTLHVVQRLGAPLLHVIEMRAPLPQFVREPRPNDPRRVRPPG